MKLRACHRFTLWISPAHPRISARASVMLGTLREHERLPDHLGGLASLLGESRRSIAATRAELVREGAAVRIVEDGGSWLVIVPERMLELGREADEHLAERGLHAQDGALPAVLLADRTLTAKAKMAAAVLIGERQGVLRRQRTFIRTDTERALRAGVSRKLIIQIRCLLVARGLLKVEYRPVGPFGARLVECTPLGGEARAAWRMHPKSAARLAKSAGSVTSNAVQRMTSNVQGGSKKDTEQDGKKRPLSTQLLKSTPPGTKRTRARASSSKVAARQANANASRVLNRERERSPEPVRNIQAAIESVTTKAKRFDSRRKATREFVTDADRLWRFLDSDGFPQAKVEQLLTLAGCYSLSPNKLKSKSFECATTLANAPELVARILLDVTRTRSAKNLGAVVAVRLKRALSGAPRVLSEGARPLPPPPTVFDTNFGKQFTADGRERRASVETPSAAPDKLAEAVRLYHNRIPLADIQAATGVTSKVLSAALVQQRGGAA